MPASSLFPWGVSEYQADIVLQTLRLGMEKVINKLLNKPEGYTRTSLLPDHGKNVFPPMGIVTTVVVAWSGVSRCPLRGSGVWMEKKEGREADVAVQDMISLPDLPQTKANKHLQALVTRKLVAKESAPVSYHLPEGLCARRFQITTCLDLTGLVAMKVH